MWPIGGDLVTRITSANCWGTHFLYLSNPPSGNLLPIIPWLHPKVRQTCFCFYLPWNSINNKLYQDHLKRLQIITQKECKILRKFTVFVEDIYHFQLHRWSQSAIVVLASNSERDKSTDKEVTTLHDNMLESDNLFSYDNEDMSN